MFTIKLILHNSYGDNTENTISSRKFKLRILILLSSEKIRQKYNSI